MALMSLQGRTVPSACAAQTTRLFFTNDAGTYFVKESASPEDPAMTKVTELSAERLDIPRQLPFMLSFNQWYANRPGSTYFIPVTEIARSISTCSWCCSVMSTAISLWTPTTEMNACGLDRFKKSRRRPPPR